MDIRAVIVDDEAHCRDALSAILQRKHPEVELLGMAGSVPEGIALVGRTKPDLVFLDVEMAPHTGFDLLQALGSDVPHVVFTTAHESYALKAIRFSALDFLLKPMDMDDLADALGKVKERMRKPMQTHPIAALLNNVGREPDGRIAIPGAGGLELVLPGDILYLVHTGDAVELHRTVGKPLFLESTMRECEDLLGESGFIRLQRIHLINPRQVREYAYGSVIMTDGTRIPVEKHRDAEVRRALGAI